MAYELKYTIAFTDKHNTAPLAWLIEIYTDGAAPGITQLMPSGDSPLLLEYDNSEESKNSYIIGRKATIRYVYTGAEEEPLPDTFTDVDERKNKVIIYKDGEVDGIYFIKPDAGQWDYAHAPFDVELTAVDGLAFAKGTPVVAREDGSLIYEKQSLNVFLPRIIYQVIDPSLPINALTSMRPNGLVSGHNMWTDVKVHTDMFFDFVDGAKSVYDSLLMFCTSFVSRLYPAKGALWFVRNSDLYDSVPVVNIVSGSEVLIPDFQQDINPDTLPAVDDSPTCSINPALKQASFKVDYRSINQLVNFDWSAWSLGAGFANWNGDDTATQGGDGSLENPYVARLPYTTDAASITQSSLDEGVFYAGGDIIEISYKYTFTNTKNFRMVVYVFNTDTLQIYSMQDGGSWIEGIFDTPPPIEMRRSGTKRDGSYKIKTEPIPSRAGNSLSLVIAILYPNEKSYHEPAEDGDIIDSPVEITIPHVDIYPIKAGGITFNYLGRQAKITNTGLFSKVLSEQEFNFIDTGEARLSNTLFLEDAPVNGWVSTKPDLPTQDIERKMAQAYIDGYARSVRTFEATIYSNGIEFYNIFTIAGIVDRKFMLLRDSYDVKDCRHSVLLAEVLPENGADTIYSEKDLDDN